MKIRTLVLAALAALPVFGLAAEPKRVLVVGASVGFRHGSIPNTEKLLRDLAAKSNGEFTVTMMSDAPDYPFPRVQSPLGTTGTNGGLGAPTGFPGTIPGASAELQAAIGNAAGPRMPALGTVTATAHTALVEASFRTPSQIGALASALATAETSLAMARADALSRLQASANRITPAQIQNLAGNFPPAAGRGGANQNQVLAGIFQTFMGPEALKNYDAIVFVSTTGNLPIPDEKAFLDWVAAGHPVIALHASMDRGAATSDAQMEMLGGGARFAGHPGNGNLPRKIYKVDATHPATKDWPDGVAIVDEYYQFYHMGPSGRTPGVDWSKVHSLLDMDFEGTRMPVAWTKMHGNGRVFYTSLGHRDDVVLPFVNNLDYGYERENGNWIALAYQKHLLEGIRWALGFTEGDRTLGNHPK